MIYFIAFGMKAAGLSPAFWLPGLLSHAPGSSWPALFRRHPDQGRRLRAASHAHDALFRPSATCCSTSSALSRWRLILMFGVIGALAQSDIRRLLGWIVVSGIGVHAGRTCIGAARPGLFGHGTLRDPFDAC